VAAHLELSTTVTAVTHAEDTDQDGDDTSGDNRLHKTLPPAGPGWPKVHPL